MKNSFMHEWESCYIYVRDGIYDPSFDWVIIELADPIVKSLSERGIISGYFFARLVSGMPHLRLRFASTIGRAHLHHEVEELLEKCSDKRHCGFSWTTYEPELERYGGAFALGASERFFGTSSTVVSALLPYLSDRARSSRLGVAAVLMLQTCRAFVSSDVSLHMLFTRYAKSYFGVEDADLLLRAANDCVRSEIDPLSNILRSLVVDPLCLGEPFNTLLVAAEELARHCDRLHAAGTLHRNSEWPIPGWSVLSSQIHMTNNRLGISRDEECYLANVLALQTRILVDQSALVANFFNRASVGSQ